VIRPIYLDYAATTPVDPAVVDAMQPWWGERFGNPHSPHRWGYEAAAAVAVARQQVAALLGGAPGAVTFTGGATESVNWALKGAMTAAGPRRRRLVTLATEHSCVLESARYLAAQGYALTVLGVAPDGLIDLDQLDAALADDVALVSAMLVNNETGVIQPIAAIAARARAHGALMHCDAAQGFGKLPTPVETLGVDLLSLTAHKLYGPKGIGALYVRPGVALTPLLHGGGQEDGGRSGTLAPALCVGLGTAAAIAAERMAVDTAHVRALWDRLLALLTTPYQINGSVESRWFGTLNLRFDGIDGTRLLAGMRGLAISSGSACASGSGRPSLVLAALGLDTAQAKASFRLGWGRFTTVDEIDSAAALLNAATAKLRALAA
jgi:cysteine desulfurase